MKSLSKLKSGHTRIGLLSSLDQALEQATQWAKAFGFSSVLKVIDMSCDNDWFVDLAFGYPQSCLENCNLYVTMDISAVTDLNGSKTFRDYPVQRNSSYFWKPLKIFYAAYTYLSLHFLSMVLPLPKDSVSSRNNPALALEKWMKCLVSCFTGGEPKSRII